MVLRYRMCWPMFLSKDLRREGESGESRSESRIPFEGPMRVNDVAWWSSRAGCWIWGTVLRRARSCRAYDSVDRRSCSWRRSRELGAGGHFKTQKAVGLLGSERRKNRYRSWSSLLISTELLLRAILAVFRIAVRSGARTEGFGGIFGDVVVGSRDAIPVEGCGRQVAI
jgi:hypothetical protein